jgi:hypothetical protein
LSGTISPEKRGTAFGVFDTGFGVAWFIGSAVTGLLYGKSIMALVVFSVALQLFAFPVLGVGIKQGSRAGQPIIFRSLSLITG